ncbi:hypothetical protein BZG36_05137 [Bifiguratus adelaidae]|uniref:feruloyl esterase n=1 Tax=Bifiguratus adelaidae TaxID=1938954 RepID=A0A261XW59_9FUNG|nr:hypothetical protein BZG36_05137 [Bifiguratus adelaidae]
MRLLVLAVWTILGVFGYSAEEKHHRLHSQCSKIPNRISGRCSKPLPRGQIEGNVYNITITSSGIQRNFLVSVPPCYYTQGAVPLILSFHGGTQTSEQQLQLDQFANPNFNMHTMVAYPQGLNGIPGLSENVPDLQFTSDVIDYFHGSIVLTATEFGLPANLTRIAAFAPVSGAFYVNTSTCDAVKVQNSCHPGRPKIPFIEFHGGDDTTIAYNGGPRKGECLPTIPHYIQNWALFNGLSPHNISEPFAVNSTKFSFGTGIEAGLVAQYYEADIGHDWPSTVPNDDNSRPGRHVASFNATPIILSFFNEYPLERSILLGH